MCRYVPGTPNKCFAFILLLTSLAALSLPYQPEFFSHIFICYSEVCSLDGLMDRTLSTTPEKDEGEIHHPP